MIIMCAVGVIMSINNNKERRKEAFFVWTSSGGGGVTSASIIIAFTILLAGGFVLISPTPMIATAAFAQEEENNTTTAGATTTTTTSDTTSATTTPPSSLGLELSPHPIWEEEVSNTGVTPINETHTLIAFIGNGTLTVPDTGETINMTNNGTALVSSETGSAYGRENVFSEDDDTTAITFYEIVEGDPETLETRGVIIAVFDRNGTDTLAPFNGMLTVGIHDEQPNTEAAAITLWEWESGIGRNAGVDAPPVQGEPPMNITTTTNATAADTNATAADEEGGGEREGQQQQTTPTIPAPLLG
jgi:hypothetical protein